jgi:hypothetical protein
MCRREGKRAYDEEVASDGARHIAGMDIRLSIGTEITTRGLIERHAPDVRSKQVVEDAAGGR